MTVQQVLDTLAQRLGSSAHVKNVYGEPVTVGDKTIIPIARVGYGFGGGGGTEPPQAAGQPVREGGGAGGGAGARPIGVLEITPGGTRFIGMGASRKLIVAAISGFVAGMLAGWKCRRR